MAKWRKSLALFLAVVMVVTFTISGIVLPTSAEGEATEPTSEVVYSENFEGDHGWTQSDETIEATVDGENKALYLSTAATTFTSPSVSAALKAGTDYMVTFKLKTTCETEGILDSITIGFKPGSASKATSTLNLISQDVYKAGYYIVPTTEWVYMMGYFSVADDADTLQVSFKSAAAGDDGTIPVLIDDVDVVEVTPNTNLAVGGDFEEARPFWANDYYKNGYNTGTTTVTDGNTTLKVAMSTSNKATYFRMVGIPKKSVFEVSFRYKGRYGTNTFQNTTVWQKVTGFGSSSSDSWREFKGYLFTKTHGNTTGCNIFSCYPYSGVEIDDLCVRKVDIDVPETMSMYLGKTEALDISIEPSTFSTAPTLTYTSSDDTVLTVDGGIVTAVSVGTATVTVTDANNYELGSCLVTVEEVPTVSEIILDKTEAEIMVGNTMALSASWLPEDAAEPEIVWSSSDDTIATVADGVVTAIAEGDVTIYAAANGLDVEPAACNVTVIPIPKATAIVLDQTEIALQEDATAQLTATWIPAEATPTIVWTSSNEQVVTVVDGELTAVAAGRATISATAEGLDIDPATCRVTVTAKNLIKNGDFENGTTAWAASTSYIQATGGKDNSGSFNLVYTHDGSVNKQFSLRYGGTNLSSLKPNTKYVLSFDYKAYGAGFPRLSCWTNGISDTAFSSSGWTKTIPDEKKEWTRYTLTFTTLGADAIAAASKGYIFYFEYVMYGNADGTGTGTFTIDNISLCTAPATATALEFDKTAGSVEIGDTATLTPFFLPAGAPSEDLIWATDDDSVATVANGVVTGVGAGVATITATASGLKPIEFKVQVETENLIKNGDFENGADSYWEENETRIQQGFGKDGSYGLQSERTSTTDDWAAGNGQYYKAALLDKLSPNTTYVLSFDYKNTGSGRGQLYVNYNFGTIGESTAWDANHAYELPAGEVDWRTITITFTTPETITTNARWEFNPRSRGKVGFTYYDNFRLVEAATAGIGSVYTDIAVEEGELSFIPAGDENATETLKDVEAGTEVTVEVAPKDGYLMVPGSLKYVSSVTGQETKILNKELGFNAENFGSEEFSGDTFTFTMPEAGASVTAEFIPISEQNFAMDTVGTGLRVKGEEYDGIRFLTRMNMAFSFNEIAAQDEIALTVTYQGVEYTVKELGSMLVRASDELDVDAMTPADAATYWKKSVAYTEGGDMTLLDYTNRYIDFTVVVTKGANVSAEDFEAREYSARGYMILEDAEGQTKTIVCDNVMTNSVNSAKGKVA